jgi:hypothetical protein
MSLSRGLVWASAALALAATPARACMSDQSKQEIAEGKLAIASKRDAAGRPEKPYILTLSSPACLTAQDPADSVKSTRTIHIFSSQDQVHAQIARFVGKTGSGSRPAFRRPYRPSPRSDRDGYQRDRFSLTAVVSPRRQRLLMCSATILDAILTFSVRI